MAEYACDPMAKTQRRKIKEFLISKESGLLCFSASSGFNETPVREMRLRELARIQQEINREFEKFNEYYESVYAQLNGKVQIKPSYSTADILDHNTSETVSSLLALRGVSHSLVLSLDVDCDEKELVEQVKCLVKEHKKTKHIAAEKKALKKPSKRRTLEDNKIVQLLDIHIYSRIENIAPSYPLIADLLGSESDGDLDEASIANAVNRYLLPMLTPEELKKVMYEICHV